MELIRDILDKQIVDRDETKMGRVDGLVLALRDKGPPEVDHLELGFLVLARRVHPRCEKWLQALRKRWSVRRSGRYLVPWSQVIEVKPYCIRIDVKALETPAFDWERWLRNHIMIKIPGSDQE